MFGDIPIEILYVGKYSKYIAVYNVKTIIIVCENRG